MEISQRRIFSEGMSKKIFLFSNLVISFGILMVTVGGEWDITNHLLNKPETFFAPPHALLYTGVAIALIGTVVMFSRWHAFSSDEKTPFKFPVRLGIIGIFLLVGAGPIDFVWHSAFGLDGLLSPPHQMLLSGMMVCSVASMVSILRFGQNYRGKNYSIHHFLVVLALLPVLLVSTGFLYSFSLPFSDTDYFDFNPEKNFAVVFATISMPFLISSVLVMTSKVSSYKFGILSITGILLLLINATTTIVANPALEYTIPFYFMTIIPFVVSDVILAISQNKKAIWAAGGILGTTFPFLYFPLITYAFNEVVYDRVISASMIMAVYFEWLPIVYPIVIGPAIIMGILGTKFADKVLAKIAWK